MKVLLADPGASYRRFENEIDSAVKSVLESGWYILGKRCEDFQDSFASFCGTTHCIGVANGTDAVELALRGIGIQAGDSILTVANTAVATVSAIQRIGAVPVFADVEYATQTLSPSTCEQTLQSNPFVKAIVVVHLFGQPADMRALLNVAGRYNISIIEDCAQAHGAISGGQRVGSIGSVGAFSFYPTKNLGAFGDGGCVVTNDRQVMERISLLRQYGWRERYKSEIYGFNSRLDELQAAVLQVKLAHLDEDNDQRRQIAKIYCERLAGLPVLLPNAESITEYRNDIHVSEGCQDKHVYHQFVIRTAKRNELMGYLKKQGIDTGILYPVPIHKQTAYSEAYKETRLPVTEKLATELLCLPIYPELHLNHVEYVCQQIRNYYETQL
ncbi:MAG: DegT/DnrJ/EryC1/StrS family aminotransferase [bacterium]